MKKYIDTVQAYIHAHKKDISTAVPIVAILAGLIGVVAYAALHDMPNIVYQPVKACDLLTPSEAQGLLGEKMNSVEKNEPVITDDNATSKCSYTDLNTNAMKVAAIAVRSGINDEGLAKNKSDFAAAKASNADEIVEGVGDSAYFNKTTGQMNVLHKGNWIILSYGVGAEPQANTVEQLSKLADVVLK